MRSTDSSRSIGRSATIAVLGQAGRGVVARADQQAGDGLADAAARPARRAPRRRSRWYGVSPPMPGLTGDVLAMLLVAVVAGHLLDEVDLAGVDVGPERRGRDVVHARLDAASPRTRSA